LLFKWFFVVGRGGGFGYWLLVKETKNRRLSTRPAARAYNHDYLMSLLSLVGAAGFGYWILVFGRPRTNDYQPNQLPRLITMTI
jgi:hypothetical protein